MPVRQTTRSGGATLWSNEYATNDLQIDLTSDRAVLEDGQASVIIGRDIVRKNRLGVHPGRRPIEVDRTSINVAIDFPLTSVIPSEFKGVIRTAYRAFSGPPIGDLPPSGPVNIPASSLTLGWESFQFHMSGSRERVPFTQAPMVTRPRFTFTLTEPGVSRYGLFSKEMIGGSITFIGHDERRAKRVVDVRDDLRGIILENTGWGEQEIIPKDLFGTTDNIINAAFFKVDVAAIAFMNFSKNKNGGIKRTWTGGAGSEKTERNSFEMGIAWNQKYDKRGIWVSNGQKFWLLQGGTYKLYMDLGNDSNTKGLAWRGSQISPYVFMFTNATQVPRVISLNDSEWDDSYYDVGGLPLPSRAAEHIAGMVPPVPDPEQDQPDLWFESVYITGGLGLSPFVIRANVSEASLAPAKAGYIIDERTKYDLIGNKGGVGADRGDGQTFPETSGSWRIKIRLANRFTGAVSRFVDLPFWASGETIDETDEWVLPFPYIYVSHDIHDPIPSEFDGWQRKTTSPFGILPGSMSGFSFHVDDRHGPQQHLLAFIIKSVWRTGNVYSTGTLSELGTPGPNDAFRNPRATHMEIWRTIANGVDFFLEETIDLVFEKGLAPYNDLTPVTSGLDRLDTVYTTRTDTQERIGYGDGAGTVLPTYLRYPEKHIMLATPDSDLRFKQLLDERLLHTGGVPPRSSSVIGLLGVGGGVTVLGGQGEGEPISIQNKTISWPSILSDESIYFSELGTATPLPESFNIDGRFPDIRILSSFGDTFKGFAHAGNVALVIMQNGAHRVERTSAGLATRSLGRLGIGTPWADSILEVGERAVWATPSGLRIYEATPDQLTGRLDFLEHEKMSEWFLEALRDGHDIEAGFDSRFNIIHFRRKGTGDCACINLSTRKWTLLEGFGGLRYVNSTMAGPTELNSPALYSITVQGMLIEENYTGDVHPYDGLLLEDNLHVAALGEPDEGVPKLDILEHSVFKKTDAHVKDFDRVDFVDAAGRGTYTITKNGEMNYSGSARPSGTVWSSLMRDETIWFSAGGKSFSKIILSAADLSMSFTNSFTTEEFKLFALTDVRYDIAPTRLRIRWAPFRGSRLRNTKTLEQLSVEARPGTRHTRSGSRWGGPPKLTVNIYRDLSEEPIASETDISVFDDADLEKESSDRFSGVTVQGNQIEVELVSTRSKADFTISSVLAKIKEEGDVLTDVTATA